MVSNSSYLTKATQAADIGLHQPMHPVLWEIVLEGVLQPTGNLACQNHLPDYPGRPQRSE